MTEAKPVAVAEPALAGVNFSALLGDPKANGAAPTALEAAIEQVTPEDALAATAAEATFSFRSLLTEQQRADLKANAPAAARKMLADYNAILAFGAPVMEKYNADSVAMLAAQSHIEVPDAEVIVNDLLREMDGYEAKVRNAKMEDAVSKLKAFFRSNAYSFKAMVREAKPIAEKLDIAEERLRQMELKLEDNVSRGQVLHKNTLETLKSVIAVLAALEEIQEAAHAQLVEVDALVRATEAQATTEGNATVTYNGEVMDLTQLKDLHAAMAQGVGELEKTWFDWRQMFFMGTGQAPTIRNLILVSATMRRRCQVFRTMGIPSARRGLAISQQAVLAREGGKMGEAVSKGTNTMIQYANREAADAVVEVARQAQTPTIDEATILSTIESVRKQCEGLIAADKWGRDLRAKNLRAMEAGEKAIDAAYTASRKELAAAALAGNAAPDAAPAPDADVLAELGVK